MGKVTERSPLSAVGWCGNNEARYYKTGKKYAKQICYKQKCFINN